MTAQVTVNAQKPVEQQAVNGSAPSQPANAPAGVGSAPSSIQSANAMQGEEQVAVKKDGYLETTIQLAIPPTETLIFKYPMIWTANGFGFDIEEFGTFDLKDWPQGKKITIQHDAQTKEDGTELCSNGKLQVRVKHTLTVRQ